MGSSLHFIVCPVNHTECIQPINFVLPFIYVLFNDNVENSRTMRSVHFSCLLWYLTYVQANTS